METIKIPGVPVNASRIGLGTWAIGGWMWGGTEESEAISTIHAAFDKGIISSTPRRSMASAAPKNWLARRFRAAGEKARSSPPK